MFTKKKSNESKEIQMQKYSKVNTGSPSFTIGDVEDAEDGDEDEEISFPTSKFNTKNNFNDKDKKNIEDDDEEYSVEPTSLNLLNRLTFRWMNSLLKKGKEKPLEAKDLPPLPLRDTSNYLYNLFKASWDKQILISKIKNKLEDEKDKEDKLKHEPSLVLAFLDSFGKPYILAGFYKLIHDSLLFIGPNLLHSFIKFLADPDKPTSYGLTLVFFLFITNLLMSLLLRQYFWACFRVGMNVRSAVISAIYTHALSLPPSLPALSLGSLTNLMSVDSTRLQDLTPYLHAIWYSLFQIILAVTFLYQLLSFATFSGITVILVSIPLTKKVGIYMKTLQKELSKLRDERVRLMNEVLNGMKIIKLQAWEKEFENRILELRENELRVFRKYSISQAFSSALFTAIPLVVAISTFTTYVALGNELDVATALTSLVLFELLRFPLFMFPQVMNNIVEAKVSVDRIQNFLCYEEKVKIKGGDLTEVGAVIDNSSLVWQNALKVKHLRAQEKNREITHRLENKIYALNSEKKSSSEDTSEKINTLLDDQILGSDVYSVDFNDPYYQTLLQEVEKTYLKEIEEARKSSNIFTEENLEILYGDATTRGSWSTKFLKVFHYLTGDRFNSNLPDYEKVFSQINSNSDKENERPLTGLEINYLVKEELLIESELNYKSVTSSPLKPLVNIPKSQILTLTNLSLDFKLGNLYSVVGQVGSGKSSLLQSLLGNLRICTGKINIAGKIAYHPQVPFIMNATVRENILFGKPFDEKKYNETLLRCALIDDLKLLPNGDSCEIGEKGINLSGGQKARVSLARCFYSDHDVFLLDDPLSAVDAHVGNHLFHQCLLHLVKEKGKCVVLVTNALQYVKFSNEVIVLKEGKVVEKGNFNNIMNSTSSSNLRDMINTMQQELQQHQADGTLTSETTSEKKVTTSEAKTDSTAPKSDGKLMTTEDREVGDVDWKVYKNYAIAAGGSFILFSLIFMFGLSEFTSLITSWWLSYWSEHQVSSNSSSNSDSSNSSDNSPSPTSLAVNFLAYTTGATNFVSYSHVDYFDEFETDPTSEPSFVPTFSPTTSNSSSTSSFLSSPWFFLSIYVLLNLSIIVISLLRDFYLRFKGLTASKHFYRHLLTSLLHAPLSFYETTPLGRIINRASKDIYVIDEQLPSIIRGYLSTMAKVISVLFYIIVVTPVFIFALIFLSLIYYFAQKYYISTSRELTRIESTARSPIYALFGESLEGLSTIHAYSEYNKPKFSPSTSKDGLTISNRLLAKNSKLVDNNQVAYMLNFSANCWLAVRLEFVGTLIVTFAALFAVLNRHRILDEYEGESHDEIVDRLKAFSGLAGLSVSLALSVTQSLNWTVRMASDLESMMISTERVQRYAHHLQQESSHFLPSDPRIETKSSPKNITNNALHSGAPTWPTAGKIEFRNVYMRYRPHLPCVLKGVSLVFPPSIKVGVVGRTGAGKSTLLSALLRLVEIDPFVPLDGGENGLIEGIPPSYGSQESKIFIDGVDISKLGLHCLRRSISVIPQDPVLFSGTIRKNLDPFEEYSEKELLEALQRTLWVANNNNNNSENASSNSNTNASSSTLNLDSPVTEGGSNLSVGQRQLLCIARALLAHSKIIVMDEATAAVDVETDALIQKTIRSEFAHATTITVAHRLNTIMDSDKVLVMDKGRVGEYDTPANLLKNPSSLFYQLVHNWEKSNE